MLLPHETRKPSSRNRRSADSLDHAWGWFEDFESPGLMNYNNGENGEPLQRSLSLPPPATSPPMYVLESSLSTQHLWYVTAGQRPKQPDNERKYFERLWMKNFESSGVQYKENELFSAELNERIEKLPSSEFDCEIIYRGKGPFSNSVSKSFVCYDLASLTIQVI